MPEQILSNIGELSDAMLKSIQKAEADFKNQSMWIGYPVGLTCSVFIGGSKVYG